MFVTVLGRMAGIHPDAYSSQRFDDVDPDEWYAPYVEWATQKKVVSGYGNGKFGPEDPITREQICLLYTSRCV